MALAGAERIFQLIDEAGKDEGYVTLVMPERTKTEILQNVRSTGNVGMETSSFCRRFCFHTELTGDVVFGECDLGYNEDKVILKNISQHAKPGQKLAFCRLYRSRKRLRSPT